jgi:hypothetical protein
MHINLVHVIHSIQNSCITYSTQNQHFITSIYCQIWQYILVIIWISIILLLQLICDFIYSAIIHMCLMSVMTSMEFSCAFDETAIICAIPAVVDTRRVLRARETTARGVYCNLGISHVNRLRDTVDDQTLGFPLSFSLKACGTSLEVMYQYLLPSEVTTKLQGGL